MILPPFAGLASSFLTISIQPASLLPRLSLPPSPSQSSDGLHPLPRLESDVCRRSSASPSKGDSLSRKGPLISSSFLPFAFFVITRRSLHTILTSCHLSLVVCSQTYAVPPPTPHSPMTSPPPSGPASASPVSAPNTPMARRVVPIVPPQGQQPIIVSTTIPNPTSTVPPSPSPRGIPVTPPPSNGPRPKRGPVKRFVYWVGALSSVVHHF
jgi:hypothetical protein